MFRLIRLELYHSQPGRVSMNPLAVEMAEEVAVLSAASCASYAIRTKLLPKAQVIYTDTGQAWQEEETANGNRFSRLQVNAKLVSEADKDVIVMHCCGAPQPMEADRRCWRMGRIRFLPSATNRLHAQKPAARLFGVA